MAQEATDSNKTICFHRVQNSKKLKFFLLLVNVFDIFKFFVRIMESY